MPNKLKQTERFLWLAALILCACTSVASAQSNPQSVEQYFAARSVSERAVAILQARCISCHGSEKKEGGLRLDSFEHLLRGGDRGAAIQVSKGKASLLVESLRGTDDDLHMPPKESLSASEIETIEQWIEAGAKWPIPGDSALSRNEGAIGSAWEDANNPIRKLFRGERLDLWSLRPLVKPTVPLVKRADWPINAIDRFVLSEWERDPSMSIAPDASPRTLAVRAAIDLTGLQPSLTQIERYLSNADPQVYEEWVDRLLSEPGYGVRWARMWLDVVRYSDSNGFDWDEFRPQAWRYRDYVVDAWNRDLPFDEFSMEQLAGDELVHGPPRDTAEQQRLIATGYLRAGPQDNSTALFNEQELSRAQLLADLTETTGSAFLGLTLACCRCHDHKTDPLSHADHYRLRAFFAPVQYADDLSLDLPERRHEIEQHNAKLDAQVSTIDDQIAAIQASALARLKATQAPIAADDSRSGKTADVTAASATDDEIKNALNDEESKRVSDLEDKKRELIEQRLEFTHGLLMRDNPSDVPVTFVLFQGDPKAPREPVNAGFPSVIAPGEAEIVPVDGVSSGRRTALARWIVSNQNPWTARVIVNRLWQGHFGEGLVATPNDFGSTGARPRYPDLLDWLARELIDSGWSIKHVQRLIVTSRVYRQATVSDPRNGLMTLRRSLRRLEAEVLRDRILTVSGLIDRRIGGPPVWPEIPAEILQANPAFLDDNATKTKGWYASPSQEQSVRSLFLVQKRTVRIPFMETFDLPDNSVSCARREPSLVAPQALALLNAPEIEQATIAMAKFVEDQVGNDTGVQLKAIFQLALLRKPTVQERAIAEKFLKTHTLAELCRALMNTNEFAFLD